MTERKRARASRLEWVRIGDLRVPPKAQREFRETNPVMTAEDFDLEGIGYPVVNFVDGIYWLNDGQHRVARLKREGFTDDDLIECEVYYDLTEAEMAELFLVRDDRKATGGFERFRIALVAGRTTETQINRIVGRAGLKVSRDEADGCIGAVTALCIVHGYSPSTLARTLALLSGAFGGDRTAFAAEMLRGAGLVAHRYDGSLTDEHIRRLGGTGTVKIKRQAEALKLKTGHTIPNCVAGAIVEAMNGGRGGQKLESWWR